MPKPVYLMTAVEKALHRVRESESHNNHGPSWNALLHKSPSAAELAAAEAIKPPSKWNKLPNGTYQKHRKASRKTRKASRKTRKASRKNRKTRKANH